MLEVIVVKVLYNISVNEVVSLLLIGIMVYEMFFDIFKIFMNFVENEGKFVLIINGVGGVGSIVI